MSGYPGRVACLDSESRIAEIVSTVRKTDGMQRGGVHIDTKVDRVLQPVHREVPVAGRGGPGCRRRPRPSIRGDRHSVRKSRRLGDRGIPEPG